MSRSLKTAAALVGFAALLSQLGHLLVYALQFGSAAQTVQSTGAHSYFPILAKASLGFAAAALLCCLLVIGASRFIGGGSATSAGAPSYVSLLALTFTVQMACFGFQETLESVAAGMAVASAPHILLLGTVGQLPVALLGSLALKWLLVRVEAAIIQIRLALASLSNQPSWVGATNPARSHLHRAVRLRSAEGTSRAKRAPPSFVRLSSN